MVEACRNSVMRTLQHPFCHSAKPELKSVLPAHARYLAEMLISADLVDPSGAPTPFATLADHLHFAEPFNIGLVALLQSGALHDLCKVTDGRNLDAVARDLLSVLASLFSRVRLHPDRATDTTLLAHARGSVVQGQLPPGCQAALDAHDSKMLRTVCAMAQAAARMVVPSETLPLSGVSFGSGSQGAVSQGLLATKLAEAAAAAPPPVRSRFAALSGKGAELTSAGELLSAARPELALHTALIPVVASATRCGDKAQLAALALDFYDTEALTLVCAESGVGSGVAWQNLRTLQLILSSLSKAVAVMAPADDAFAVAVQHLEAKFSEKFFSKLYR